MHEYLERTREVVERATGHLTRDQLERPVAGRWSVAEILEHLTLAFNANQRAVEKALALGTIKARRPALGEAVARTVVVDVGYFPSGRRAPEFTVPTGSVPPDRCRETLVQALAELDATLSRAAERFGEDTPLVNHPYFAAMSVRRWRKFHWRHATHHMKQVRDRVD